MQKNNELTKDELAVQQLAIAHFQDQGVPYEPEFIYANGLPEQEYLVYVVLGNAKKKCAFCDELHKNSEFLVFLRVGGGFVLLAKEKVTRIKELSEQEQKMADILKVFKQFYMGGQ